MAGRHQFHLYALGPYQLWANRDVAVHPDVHQALRCAGNRTKPDLTVGLARKPSRNMRKAAVNAFECLERGEGASAFDISDQSGSESDGQYESAPVSV